jgi:hypothetical protein
VNQTRNNGRGACGAALTILAIVAGGSLLAGCAVTRARGEVYAEGPVVEYEEPVVEVRTVPVYIESAPRYVYRGRTVYLVDGRWYTPAPHGRWVQYRTEPRELARRRVEYRRAHPNHVEFHGDASVRVRTR